MPRQHRLSRADFARMRGFRRLQGSLFSLSYGSIPTRAASGFACVVSSKIVPRATDRNAIKRRCRAAFRGILNERRPVVCVWYAKKTAHNASLNEVRRDMADLYAKALSSLQ